MSAWKALELPMSISLHYKVKLGMCLFLFYFYSFLLSVTIVLPKVRHSSRVLDSSTTGDQRLGEEVNYQVAVI